MTTSATYEDARIKIAAMVDQLEQMVKHMPYPSGNTKAKELFEKAVNEALKQGRLLVPDLQAAVDEMARHEREAAERAKRDYPDLNP